MFWASRAEKNKDYEITDVIEPDEWHQNVSNGAYTNYMAKRNIQTALQTLEWLKTIDPAKASALTTQLELNDQRLAHWQDVQKHLRISQDKKTGLFEQFEGFFKLATLNQKQYKMRNISYQDILGIYEVKKYQIIKQADVLMLLTVLDQEFDHQVKKVNWDYYCPITDHDYGSSLTPALHVILASELGLLTLSS